MLSRLLPKASQLRCCLTNLSTKYQYFPSYPSFTFSLRHISSSNNNNNNIKDRDPWRFSEESDGKFDSFFQKQDSESSLAGISDDREPWTTETGDYCVGNVFPAAEASGGGGGGEDDWLTSEEIKPWSLDDVKGEEDKVFDAFEESALKEVKAEIAADGSIGVGDAGGSEAKCKEELEKEEKELTAFLEGPNRAFGDLIAASGITDAMLDSLIALKDFEEVEGLPPLHEIEDMRYEKNTRKSSRFEIELRKQEEDAKARVRQVDEKGRAYGTGRRKCSVARVWIQPGDGKVFINDKEFDVYFPMLDHRAALLRPFSETKSLGLWDVNCTVKGGGTTGQVGAIQLGISRALQNWEPDLRPSLRNAGFLTRDSRVVERKKPGKAKARKSFQWVKR